jgi:hypothetical protein
MPPITSCLPTDTASLLARDEEDRGRRVRRRD